MLPGITPTLFSSKAASGGLFSSPIVNFNSTPNVVLTGIPVGAKKIDLLAWGMLASANGDARVQLGASGAVQTTGYDSFALACTTTIAWTPSTTGMDKPTFLYSANALSGMRVLLTLLDPAANQWVVSAISGNRVSGTAYCHAGAVSLAGLLDRILIGAAGAANVTAGSTMFIADSSPVASAPVTMNNSPLTTLTGIPATAKQVIFSMAGVTSNGTDNMRIRIGPSSGTATAGYDSGWVRIIPTQAYGGSTVGFDSFAYSAASPSFNGHMILTLADPATNTWMANWQIGDRVGSAGEVNQISGSVSLSGPLERISFGSAGGAVSYTGKIGYMAMS